MIQNIKYMVAIVFYHAVARHLPNTFWPGGLIFSRIRVAALCWAGARIGVDVLIQRDVDFGGHPTDVEVGNGTRINPRCTIKNCRIGNDVLIAPGVVVLENQHIFTRRDTRIIDQGMREYPPVEIGEGAWLGQNVIVMPGVRIGAGAIIGAGSVVTKDIEPFMIAAGVPAKPIRERD